MTANPWLKDSEAASAKCLLMRDTVSKERTRQLWESQRIQFFARPSRNVKNSLMLKEDKLLARRRSVIETVT